MSKNQIRDFNGSVRLTSDEIISLFTDCNKHVITFSGFSELGYEDQDQANAIVISILQEYDPDKVVINCGGLLRENGQHGIAHVHRLAKLRGMTTTGIHPTIALEYARTHIVSPYCDCAFFVEDRSWGGLTPEGELSSTLLTIFEVSTELVAIGGGKYGADELSVFVENGKPTRYFHCDMNHQVTDDWCLRSGVNIDDYRGAAHKVWSELVPQEAGTVTGPRPLRKAVD